MRVPFLDPSSCCKVCGKLFDGVSGGTCWDCSTRRRPAFDLAVSAVRYEGATRKLVQAYKFDGKLYLKPDFADWMEGAIVSRFDPALIDAVVPMPVTTFHRMDRGYNQSEYLAADLAKRFSRKLVPSAVARCGSPKRQSGLSAEERLENVKGTFTVAEPGFVRGRTILLVDDIMTTGSTLSECAAEMKRAGAARVFCSTLAQAVI